MSDPHVQFAQEISSAIKTYTGQEVKTPADFTRALEIWSATDGLIKHIRKTAKELTKMAQEMERFRQDHQHKATHAIIVCDDDFIPSVKPAKTKITLTARIPTPVPEPQIIIEEKQSSAETFKLVGQSGRPIDSYRMTSQQMRNLPMAVKRAVHYSYYFNISGSYDDARSFTLEAKPSSIFRPYNTFVITKRIKEMAVQLGIISEKELALMELPDMHVRRPDEELIPYVSKYFDVAYDVKQEYMYPKYFADVYQEKPESLPNILKNIVVANRRGELRFPDQNWI